MKILLNWYKNYQIVFQSVTSRMNDDIDREGIYIYECENIVV